jgi:hypothetical protein
LQLQGTFKLRLHNYNNRKLVKQQEYEGLEKTQIKSNLVFTPPHGPFLHCISASILEAFLELLSASPSALVCGPHLHNLQYQKAV